MISKEEVRHIAKLARIRLTEGEEDSYRRDLSSVLDYFDILKKVDDSVTPVSPQNTLPGESARADEVVAHSETTNKKLLEAMPEKKERHLKVKAVFESGHSAK